MTASEARDYLENAAQTATGRQALRQLGYGAIIDAPRKGDDKSSIKVAVAVAKEVQRHLAASSAK